MSSAMESGKWKVCGSLFIVAMLGNVASAGEIITSDLPPMAQVNSALDNHLLVLNAQSGLRLELANQNKWNSGNYEFNLRAGSAQRQVVNTEQKLQEWDVALERPLRLPNKANIDHDIGAANVARADFALGDAHHEAARLLLHLWFVWQREQAQVMLWQQQNDIYTQQA
ncbi:MAG: transporter, partial [Gallionella sp.]